MVTFASLTDAERVALLQPPTGRAQIVLDTDTFNEIDDQFALAYALLSPDKIEVEAVYAAPFERFGGSDPGLGMEQSYDEILRVLSLMNHPHEGFVLKGSTRWLPAADTPVESLAAHDLIRRARQPRERPLYVVGIGAITNVASALLLAPDIAARIVVVWLAGNPHTHHRATEYNMYQDMHASRVILNSGVPLVHLPALNVTEHLRTSLAEMERYVRGRGALGDYLYSIYEQYYPDQFARSKEIWDVGAIAWLVNPAWVDTVLIHTPILNDNHTWSHDPHRPLMREALSLQRDAIFADLFRKLDGVG